jgi:membrane protein
MDSPLPSGDTLGPRSRRAWSVLRAIVHEVRVENLPFMAGSIAYHAFVSLLPLLVLLVFAVSSLADATLTDRILTVVEVVVTPSGRGLVKDAIAAENPSRGVSLFGGAVLLWTTLRIFRGLDQAFSDLYESRPRNKILDQFGDGLVVLVAVAGAVIAAGIVRSVVRFGPGLVGSVFQTAFVVLGLSLALFPMFYLFPDVDVSVREVLPGAVFAAGGITVLESLFRLYVEVGGTARSYGILGGILVLLTWLYLVGLTVLMGAAVNAVLTNRSENVNIEPVIGDWRPGIGTTFGPSAWETQELDLVSRRIGTIAEAVNADDPVVVSIGDRKVRLPPPDVVREDTDPGTDGSVGVEFRWESDAGKGPSD